MTTHRTSFAGGVPAINLDHAAPVPGSLVLQLAHKLAPADISNGFGQGGMLQHVLDRQALAADRLVLTDQSGGELVLVVSSAIGNARMDLGDFVPRLLTVLRAFFLASKPPVGLGQLLLVTGKRAGIVEGLAIGGDNHRLEPQVDPDLVGRLGQGGDFFFHQQGDKVAARLIATDGDGGRGRPLGQITRPDNRERGIHLGQGERPILPGESAAGIFGALLAMPLLEGRIVCTPLKKVAVSASQVTQALLQGHTRDFAQKGGFFLLFKRGQSAGKLLIRQPPACLLVSISLQAKGPIVHIARTAEGAGEDAPLLVRRIKAFPG